MQKYEEAFVKCREILQIHEIAVIYLVAKSVFPDQEECTVLPSAPLECSMAGVYNMHLEMWIWLSIGLGMLLVVRDDPGLVSLPPCSSGQLGSQGHLKLNSC